MSKRRKFTPQFKARVALAVLCAVQTQAEICKQHHLTSGQLTRWRLQTLPGAAPARMIAGFVA